jgi:hypothetical protein
MIQNIRLCEMCKRPNYFSGLFCPACIKKINDMKNKKIGGPNAK